MYKYINFRIPNRETTDFTVIRYFKGGKYSRIRLAISDEGNLVVLKEFLDDNDICYQEEKCWREINEVDDIYVNIIADRNTLVMPLVFHIHDDKLRKQIHIPIDLRKWSVEDKAIPGIIPEYMEQINIELQKFYYNIEEISMIAIDKCARSGYIHKDLELRHIGLLPIFNKNNDNIIDYMEPVFIDFGIMEKCDDYNKAKSEMLNDFNNLIQKYTLKGYTFINR